MTQGGVIMDKSFPSFLSNRFQIYEKKETKQTKETKKLTFLIYACINYVLNELKFRLNIEDFLVKGSNYQAGAPSFGRKSSFTEILNKMYHCYDIIIRVYELRKIRKNSDTQQLFTIFDDMTNTHIGDSTKEIEFLIEGADYYVFDKEVNFISKRYPALSVSPDLKIFTEDGLCNFLSNQRYAFDFQISNLMLYSEIKEKCFGMPQMPLTSRNIIFFYCNTYVQGKRKSSGNLPMIKKEQYKVLDKWIADKAIEMENSDGENLYFYTFFCRKTNQFNFVNVQLEDMNKTFVDTSLKQTKCELIEEQVNYYEERPMNEEKIPEYQDECFCPNLYFPMAKSSQGHPNKRAPFISLIERLSLADTPILDLLSFAAKVSISFYDIETLAKPLSANIELKEAKLSKFGPEKQANYVHSIQEAVCIGFQSLCPSLQICKHEWSNVAIADIDLDSFLRLPTLERQKKMEMERGSFESFSIALKKLIEQQLNDTKHLLDSCNVFELGTNANVDTETFDEPDAISINSMVCDWLDLAFKQAEILALLKTVMLHPLHEHIAKSTNEFKRTGDFARVINGLRDLTSNFYVFGWVPILLYELFLLMYAISVSTAKILTLSCWKTI